SPRGNDITPSALNGLHEECSEFGAARLGIPGARVLVLEQALDFSYEMIFRPLFVGAMWRTKDVGKRQELGAIADLAVSLPIAVRRRNRGGRKSPPVISPLKREHMLTAGVLADELERILDGLGAADVELNAPLEPEGALDAVADHFSELDLLAME